MVVAVIVETLATSEFICSTAIVTNLRATTTLIQPTLFVLLDELSTKGTGGHYVTGRGSLYEGFSLLLY